MIRVNTTRRLERTDLLVLFAEEPPTKDQKPAWRWSTLSGDANRRLVAALEKERFTGRTAQTFVWHAADTNAERVLVAGLGKAAKRDVDLTIRAAGAAARKARDIGALRVAAELPPAGKVGEERSAQAIAEGFMLGAYEFDRYRSREPQKSFEAVTIVAAPERALKLAEIMCRATLFARDLVNTPAGDCAPRHLADAARKLAGAHVKVTVWGPKEIEKKNMGGLIGIGKGSDEPYHFIMLKYEGRKGAKKIAVCGKGITFDSGGLCIKPADGMGTMKCDMSGAAAVLGLFAAISELKPECSVYGYIPAAENMTGGSAVKTGDVLRTASGRTIEVNNTDAEGRVVLADAMTVAREDKPDEIIDLATLTGACVVALGDQVAGLFANDDALAAGIEAAAKRAGERFWRMPIVSEYRDLLKSEIADIKNSGGRYAGAIQGALFLQEWAGEQPWAHLDIAGPAWTDKGLPYCQPGGTGFAVRTLLEYVTAQGR
ncbi:MAG: leucyl aminopeptidase [Candidatus Brocadiae bacterium]|nr:leucyl aminopeptidase [Candidatus Brocadiia bacterium]